MGGIQTPSLRQAENLGHLSFINAASYSGPRLKGHDVQPNPVPQTRDIVLIGGGHTHALALRRWGMAPEPGVRLTLISPLPTAAYSGMLPGHIAGHYTASELMIDLVCLARFAGARLILGHATGIDRAARRVHVPGRADVVYDLLSIDIGITTEPADLPGFADFGVAAKPLERFASRWQQFVSDVAQGQAAPQVVIIGGGLAGVELALAAHHRLTKAQPTLRPTITLLEASPNPLSAVGAATRAALFGQLSAAGIDLVANARVAQVEKTGVICADGRQWPSQFTLGAAGARPQRWLADTGLALTNGFIDITPTLQSANDPQIFAVGDCAHMSYAPRPKAGVFAVRQAPILHANLRAALNGLRLQRYQPQSDYLKLISTGKKSAVADRFGLHLGGAWLWRWKDRIDRRFMARFLDLPQMQTPATRQNPGTSPQGSLAQSLSEALGQGPLCGGCGAKAARRALDAGLAALPQPTRADVVQGPGDDAAVLRLGAGAGQQVLTTDHLRAFTLDPWLMARITALHAMGDVWAMGAAPQVALSQIILPPMGPELQSRTLAEITDAAVGVFAQAAADLVGGHTSLGSELTIGFTVTGLHPTAVITKTGAQIGDALILTKPLGTGVILAGEMSQSAPGAVVAQAWGSMAQSNGPAAAILAPSAHAMTDVTGFGLAGHLLEMLGGPAPGQLGATLDLAAIPTLDGAEDLAARGVRSVLFPANRALMPPLAEAGRAAGLQAKADLLFDPQTSGGLLAAVPANTAAGLLDQLHQAGYLQAAQIGVVVPVSTSATPGARIAQITLA